MNKFVFKLHMVIAVALLVLMFIFSFGTDNEVMIFIFKYALYYCIVVCLIYFMLIDIFTPLVQAFKKGLSS